MPRAIKFQIAVADLLDEIRKKGYYLSERADLRKLELEIELKKLSIKERETALREKEASLKEKEILYNICNRLTEKYEEKVSPEAIRALDVVTAERITGFTLNDFKPVLETSEWKSPTDIARKFGVDPKTFVGRIITKLGIRGNPRYSRTIINWSHEVQRNVTSFLYNAEGVQLIEQEIRRELNKTKHKQKILR